MSYPIAMESLAKSTRTGHRPVGNAKDAFAFAIPIGILAVYLFLCLQENLRIAVPEIVGATGLIVLLLAAAMTLPEEPDAAWTPLCILGFAALFRFLFLWRSPELSDDIFRYVLDGMMTAGGRNPYAAPPSAVIPDGPRMAAILSLVNHPHLVTIYPPAAQLVFALGSFGGVVGMKAVLTGFDLGACAMILKLLGRLHLPARLAVLYAWHPLPVIETGASGHLEAVAVFFLLSAFLAAMPGPSAEASIDSGQQHPFGSRFRAFAAGVLLCCAVLTKWTPLMFAPAVFLMIAKPLRRPFCGGILAAGGCLCLVFLPAAANSLKTLSTYLQDWEFSGFWFRSFRAMTGSGQTARLICILLFTGVAGRVYIRMMGDRHPAALLKGCCAIVITFLLLTPTLHPWYAVGLAAFLPFAPGMAGLVFTWSVFLSYKVVMGYALTGNWSESGILPLWIVLAPAAAAGAGLVRSRMGKKAPFFAAGSGPAVHDK